MYDEHRCFKPPSYDDAVIWRYMDLAKLVFMLHTQSLHFTRVDCFEDRFEGALPKQHVERLRQAREKQEAENPELWKKLEALGQVRVKRSAAEEYRESRATTAVNCWHQNEHESAAMWSQYLKSSDGVAVRSTYKKLINAFDNQDDTVLIFVGMVQYIDYDNETIENFDNALLPMLHKRASFRHEQELRAVALGAVRGGQQIALDLRKFPRSGIDIQVELKHLVDTIYVAPGAAKWFRKSVESIVGKYGLNVSVKQSSLDDEPIW